MTNKLLNQRLERYADERVSEFRAIGKERKKELETAAEYVRLRLSENLKAKLVFICTHNSRRSHISQIWAQTAAHYYGLPGVETYSGGTEATAFHPNAVKALRETGLQIEKVAEGTNPVYHCYYSNDAPPVQAFSKVFDAPENPSNGFAAIMTCSHADENCPFVPGAEQRFLISYDDPKDFDQTPGEERAYRERTMQIACEMLYLFSKI